MNIKKIGIIGLGYVGLPTLVAIANTGKYEVVGFDIDAQKIGLIKKRISPIEDTSVNKYLSKHKIKVSTTPSIINSSDIFIICVPTPVKDNFKPDYTYLKSAVRLVARYIKKGSHVVLESTVNPGACREILLPILKRNCKLIAGIDYNVTHCPERLNPGDLKWNITNINRNIGSITLEFNTQIADFYRSFVTDAKINEVSTLEIAEASKIVENTFRDINIAFVNELAKSFDAMNINLIETLQAASNKPFAFLPHWPGTGVGGHCIGVDPYYLIKRAAKNGFNHKFLKLARKINNSMPKYTVEKLQSAMKQAGLTSENTNILLLGLAFKPNIGDQRESPALEIKKELKHSNINFKTYDPFVKSDYTNLDDAIKEATVMIIATAHNEFLAKLPKLLPKSKIKIIIDGRNCLDKNMIEKLNIVYKGIGR